MINGHDSTEIGNIPADTGAVVCYSDRRFKNDTQARARFPELAKAGRIVALAAVTEPPDSELAGDGVDTEPGNLPPGAAAASIKARIALGHWRPIGYADLFDMHRLISDLHFVGVPTPPPGPQRPWRCLTAHPTGIPHTCGPLTCGQLPVDADGTQWWWSSMQNPGGPDLDRDRFRDDFFKSTAVTPPPTPENVTMNTPNPYQTADHRIGFVVTSDSAEVLHIEQQNPPGSVDEQGKPKNTDFWRKADGSPNWLSLGHPGK